MLPLPTPAEIAIWDQEAIETIGIPGIILMESASREAVNVLLEEFGTVDGTTICCFAGSGNNGGDAFAMARHLSDLGAKVTVLHTRPQERYEGETSTNFLWAQKLGISLAHLAEVDINALPQPDIVIDGLLGTGFEGELRQDSLDLVRCMNRLGERAFILSIDIPSGLSGLTGTPQPEAVVADATATFETPKLGLVMPGADDFTGTLHVCPIGIPLKVQEDNPVRHHLLTGEIMHSRPHPKHDTHKGRAGHVLIIGGSQGLTGAPHLAAMGALRAGAGLVTVACPGGLAESVKSGSPDIMTFPLGHRTVWTPLMAYTLHTELDRFDTVIVGPGIGRDEGAQAFLNLLIPDINQPLVLDADGLFALSEMPDLRSQLPEQTILTPHPGEMARLLGSDSASVQADRLAAAGAFVKQCDATLVLKGAGTIIAGETMTCLSPFSEPNLAVGGSGDVLAGTIGALMAGGLPPMHAASLGVYWHGLAGNALKEEFPLRGNLASEIARMLPHVITINEELEPC